MVIHSYTGLYSEVTPSQEIGGGGARNTALPDRERSTIVWYLVYIYWKEYMFDRCYT